MTRHGPVEQLGCARRPVKAEVAGSNPVGTASRPGGPLTRPPGAPGQVAQSVERAAENRKVGGSIPSLPTGNVQLSGLCAEAPPLDRPRIEASLRHSWSAASSARRNDGMSGPPEEPDSATVSSKSA